MTRISEFGIVSPKYGTAQYERTRKNQMKRTRPELIIMLALVIGLWMFVQAVLPPSDAKAITQNPAPGKVTTEESSKTPFNTYTAYTTSGITITLAGGASAAYVACTTEVSLYGFAPNTVTTDAKFPVSTIGTVRPTLAAVATAINATTTYSAVIPDGADKMSPIYDLATVRATAVTTGNTFVFTSSKVPGIGKAITAVVGKKIYLTSVTVSATGSGTLLFRVYDGATVVFYSVLASGTEKTFVFPWLAGTTNTEMYLRVTGATTLTAGYINAQGYTR
jgi:hypothetical protein